MIIMGKTKKQLKKIKPNQRPNNEYNLAEIPFALAFEVSRKRFVGLVGGLSTDGEVAIIVFIHFYHYCCYLKFMKECRKKRKEKIEKMKNQFLVSQR